MNSFSTFLIVSLVYLSVGVQSQTLKCPDRDKILPCTCTEHGPLQTHFDCSAAETNDQLAAVFNQKLDNYRFGEMRMIESPLETLRTGDFGKASFVQFMIEKGSFRHIEPLAFEGSFGTAKEISFSDNNVTSFSYDDLPKFRVLERLDLTGNGITEFPDLKSNSLKELNFNINNIKILRPESLQNLPNLEWACFGYNEISEILPGTFTSFPKLNYFSFHTNNLTKISTGTFQLHGESSTLNLGDNMIDHIEVGAIKGVTNWLSFSPNRLRNLTEEIWRPIFEEGTDDVNLFGNPLTCGCDIDWLIRNPTFTAQAYSSKCHSGDWLRNLDPAEFYDC